MKVEITLTQWFGIVGASIAANLSLTANHSILWATLHAHLGWFYVIYYAMTN